MRSSFFNLFLFASALIIAACSAKTEDTNDRQMNPSEGAHDQHAAMDMGEPSEGSIYHASSTWLDRNNQERQLKDLRGKVQVVALAYTSCEYACPTIVTDMKDIQKELPEEVRNSTNFVLVSIDPERDTPQRLNQFATENNLDEEYWTLLNGERGDILELSALLGFRYQRINETDFSHSNLITVLNKKGEVVHQRKKLTDRPSEIIAEIKQASE